MKITILQLVVLTSCILTAAYAAPTPAFIPEKGKTALIVVDMQNDFVRDGGNSVCLAINIHQRELVRQENIANASL